MLPVRFNPPAAKYIKKLKDKKLKRLYQEAVDKICEDYTVGELKTGDLAGFYGYDIYYNKTNYELAYTVEWVDGEMIIVVMAGTRETVYRRLTMTCSFFEHFALDFGTNRQKQETKIIQNGKYILFIKIWFANSEIRFFI